jgi:hypothetical protein
MEGYEGHALFVICVAVVILYILFGGREEDDFNGPDPPQFT